ncbi:UvrD-helicase domain-containing protein [Cardinium endosymbiont of Nabis limbatus]|uniref:UvrD-helicase domain-containing protein n=1 Tax=Cardinium endosymbiont of Nabis limbatus TaxID=3066217 RepID=UPI003AF34F04
MAQLLIYRASAGSGKTHTLVTHYIEWALRYPDAFKHILAVTFTNRATQEMKERILAYLYRLSIGEEKVLQERLCQTGWTPTQLQLRSKEVLSMMVYQYGDFSVTTIDSFFYKIIQSFAQSLGLPDHFSIEMDEPLALQETIEALCNLDDPFLQKWIVDFALTKLVAGKSWNVKSNIQELGKALFDASFKIHEKRLLTAFQQQEIWSGALLATQKSLHAFEHKMQKIGQNALNLLKQEGFTPEDFSYGTKGVIGYFLKLASKKGFQPTKRALIGSNELKSWYSRSKTNEAAHIASVVKHALHPLLMEAITLYAEEGLAYRTGVVGTRFTYAFGMIGALLIGLEAYRAKHNLLFMSDISALLYQTIQQNDIPFLYEKIGNQFHHFLIDEFQDLSLFQWMNIKPLLHNSLAQGYTSVLVGDVKQSIYRWRGSNWKILNHQVEAEYKESSLYSLTSNRRSQKAIVLFNNHFFKKAASQLVDYLESTFPSIDPLPYELAQMRQVYDEVAQKAEAHKGGYVELLLLKPEPTEGHPVAWQTQAQKALVALLEKLQKEGVPARDIVLLVRNNSEATLLTGLFNHTTGPYKVQSDHAYALWNHIAIKVLIHALYYLNDEDDLINRVAWIEAYCSCMGKDSGMGHHDRFRQAVEGSNGMERLLPRSFWAQKDFLKNLSVYSCVALLINCLFRPPHGFGDVLAFFQSMVLNFSLTEAASIEAFLAWWEKRGRTIKLPTSQDENRTRVMTIHQSKGLAFKVVVMPFCSWGLDHPNGPILWSVNHPQPDFFPIWPVSYGTDLKETDYAQDYYLEQMQIYLDNLNLLYVAFTRAEAQLYVMAPLPGQNKGMATIADVIYQTLAEVPWAVEVQETDLGTRFSFR